VKSNNCISTGDIIGYVRNPKRRFSFLKSGTRSIAGNVEKLSGADDCGCDFTKGSRCDDFSQLWYPFAKKLSASSLSYISALPEPQFSYAGKKSNRCSWFLFQHL
jgi:hypothetical protein